MGDDVVSIDDAVAWLEQHAPDAVDDLRLLGKTRFGGDTPAEFVMSAYRREVEKLAVTAPTEAQ